jgi:hypothetical protein
MRAHAATLDPTEGRLVETKLDSTESSQEQQLTSTVSLPGVVKMPASYCLCEDSPLTQLFVLEPGKIRKTKRDVI